MPFYGPITNENYPTAEACDHYESQAAARLTALGWLRSSPCSLKTVRVCSSLNRCLSRIHKRTRRSDSPSFPSSHSSPSEIYPQPGRLSAL
jgi:hypothetical protein